MGKHIFEFYNIDKVSMNEAYNSLRVNIQFSSKGKEVKTISVVSADPYEGRTTVAINLAISIANDGKKALLVDADLRKPGPEKKAYSHFIPGLTEIILGRASIEEATYSTNNDNMFYMPCGGTTTFPSEMLTSIEFNKVLHSIREEFDYVIFDTPSINSVIDASVLAAKTDGTIIVVSSGKTSHKSFSQAIDQLTQVNTNILGIVLNRLPKNECNKYIDYYSRYYYTEKRK